MIEDVKNAGIVLEKCVELGVLKVEYNEIGYIRWFKTKKDEWAYSFKPIAEISKINGKITGIKWRDDIYSPASLLNKLIKKHHEKLKSVAEVKM